MNRKRSLLLMAGMKGFFESCCLFFSILITIEKINRAFHRICFRCSVCKNVLGAGHSSIDGKFFCASHNRQSYQHPAQPPATPPAVESSAPVAAPSEASPSVAKNKPTAYIGNAPRPSTSKGRASGTNLLFRREAHPPENANKEALFGVALVDLARRYGSNLAPIVANLLAAINPSQLRPEGFFFKSLHCIMSLSSLISSPSSSSSYPIIFWLRRCVAFTCSLRERLDGVACLVACCSSPRSTSTLPQRTATTIASIQSTTVYFAIVCNIHLLLLGDLRCCSASGRFCVTVPLCRHRSPHSSARSNSARPPRGVASDQRSDCSAISHAPRSCAPPSNVPLYTHPFSQRYAIL